MIKKTFWANWSMLKSENGTLKIISLGLTVGIIACVMVIANLADKRTVVVIPPKLNKEFQVSGNEISKEYFEQTGYYLADRILSVSPGNVDGSFDSVMSFFTTNPEDVKAIRENLALQAEVIKQNDIYQVFYPMKVLVSPQGMNFSVEGTLKKMSGNNHISTGRAIITFGFFVKDGRMIIKNIEVK